jgi:hypothetical protein
MRLFMCHDYGPNDRAIQWETTVAEQNKANTMLVAAKVSEDFIKFRY